MDLDFSEEQEMLRNSLRSICETEAASGVVRRAETDDAFVMAGVWQELARNGFLGLRVGEQWGGAGLGMIEVAIAYHEFGRVLMPGPHFESALFAARLIELAGSDAQRARWLPGVADGSLVIVPAWREAGGGDAQSDVGLTPQSDGGSMCLNGRKCLVAHAGSADRLLVLTRDPAAADSHILLCVDARAEGVDLQRESNLASAPLFTVDFKGVEVSREDCLGLENGVGAQWDRAFIESLIPLAAQAVGGAERVLEMSIAYAKERVQFDRPIGSFQSIAHYLSDAATELEAARVLAWQAAWAMDEGLPIERLAVTAKLFACQAFRRISAVAIQVHGGLGFTTEADPQLYFRRAKHQQLVHGDTAWLEKRLAARVVSGDIPVLN